MLAIIPAGGRAERFGGIFKELLPVGDREYLLSGAIERSAELGAGRFLVISSAEKAAAHVNFLHEHLHSWDVTLTVRRRRDTQLWDSIRHVLPFCEGRNLLVLPDTTWTCNDTLPEGADLAFGVFLTDEPERFSVLDIHQNRILTKQPADENFLHLAWGCVYFSKRVADFWRAASYLDYDRAFEGAMRVFGYQMFYISNYNDLGTWEAYRCFVGGSQ